MDNMKLLRYARAAAVDKWWCYDKIATQYAGHRAESLARKLADEAKADVNAIAEMIRAEEAKRRLNADVIAELKNLVKEQVKPQQSPKAPQRSNRKEQYELCSQHTLVTRIPPGCSPKSAVRSVTSNWLTRTSCPIADSGRVFKSNCSFIF